MAYSARSKPVENLVETGNDLPMIGTAEPNRVKTDPPPPAERINYIVQALRAGEQLDPADANMAAGLLAHIVATRHRQDQIVLRRTGRAARNDAIRAAAALLPAGLSLTARAARLIAEARTYRDGRYRTDAGLLHPPPEFSGKLRGELWLAFKSHERFPWSDRAIESIISNNNSGK